jgi:2-polyprenyl-6-methoxyphenol hydroxylase-like FAD-dependent oxidoreductase
MNKVYLSELGCDVAVIGAGFCGSVLGLKAADLGLRVRAFDSLDEYPDHFRAEKLEPDQYAILEELDLIDLVRPRDSVSINEVHEFVGTKRTVVPCHNHRGMDYAATVNSFRAALQQRGVLEPRKISKICDAADHCAIYLDDKTTISARLVIVATGLGAGLRKSLMLRTHEPNALLSTSFGFDVASNSPDGFPHSAFNLRPEKFVSGLQYATFFPIGDRMRVNVFTCWQPGSNNVRNFRKNPLLVMDRLFPSMRSAISSFQLTSPLQVYTTNYYRQNCDHLKSTVVVGDAYQSVSPATGVGISKCLTDASVLLRAIQISPGEQFKSIDLRAFYNDPLKREVDDRALHRWAWANESATSRTARTNLKKIKRKLQNTGIGNLIARKKKAVN